MWSEAPHEGAAPEGGTRRRRGLFVAFEGVEGSGKTTQIRLLADRLSSMGFEIVETREPGGTPLGERIRSVLLAAPAEGLNIHALEELFLLAAARHANTLGVILPALERGAVVLADRFSDSSVAYQGGGRGLGMAVVDAVNALATAGVTPDLTVLLDLDPSVGLARKASAQAAPDRIEAEGLGFHEAVRQAYLERARVSGRRYLVVEAARPAEEIAEEVAAHVAALLGLAPR